MITSPNWKFILSRPAYFIAFGFGSGLSPFAPGTAGTLAAFPIYGLLVLAALNPVAYFALIAGLFLIGVWASHETGRALGIADYGGIVWDEIVAFLAILYFTPPTWGWFIAAFFIFRLFDVWKPFPIRYFDTHIKNGFGVMFDDALAAVYSIALIKGLASVI
ncbi:MAG: phosphatidylglycerophosphatase A family protein [Burkholderiales bacterium]